MNLKIIHHILIIISLVFLNSVLFPQINFFILLKAFQLNIFNFSQPLYNFNHLFKFLN